MANDHFKFGSTLLVEQELIDFSNIQRKGKIELIPLRKTRHLHNPECSFRCFFNTKTSKWHGIPIGKNPDGTFKFKPIRVSAGKSYNLENKQDAEEWAVVKDYYRIKGGDMERDPLFMIDDVEADADKKEENVSKTIRAYEYVKSLSGNKLVEFGRLFGVDPNNNSHAVIKKMLYEKCETKPVVIIEKIESEGDTQIHIILKRALAVGTIKNSIDRGYIFKDGIVLGSTEKGSIEFMRKDFALTANIDAESKSLDRFYIRTDEVEKKVESIVMPSITSGTANIDTDLEIKKFEKVDGRRNKK